MASAAINCVITRTAEDAVGPARAKICVVAVGACDCVAAFGNGDHWLWREDEVIVRESTNGNACQLDDVAIACIDAGAVGGFLNAELGDVPDAEVGQINAVVALGKVGDEVLTVTAAEYEQVCACAACQRVIVCAAIERVVVCAAVEDIVTFVAEQNVVARIAVEGVFLVAAVEQVRADAAVEHIAAIAAKKGVVALIAKQGVIAANAIDEIVTLAARYNVRAAERGIDIVAAQQIDAVRGHVADQHIGAFGCVGRCWIGDEKR